MKIKTICHSNKPDHLGFADFKNSMDKFGYDYIALNEPDYNWSTTFDIYLRYVKSIQNDYTHVLTTDCWDVVVLAGIDEVVSKYKEQDKGLFSVEKMSFPNPDLAKDYPATPYAWKYINCGGSLFPIPLFIEIFSRYDGKENIQEWAAKEYLKNDKILLDTNCDIFQSVAFINENDFSVEGKRVVNNYTKTNPVFIHNNGGQHHTPEWVRNLLT